MTNARLTSSLTMGVRQGEAMGATRRQESGLANDSARLLLEPHEVVRDPVHGDISLTALDRCLIDTPAFQRLRGIKQLGTTHLVYPGAVHTRFEHSLGVLAVADRLTQTMKSNYARVANSAEKARTSAVMDIEPYPELLIRLTALLHDLAQMPFGHTFSREGGLGEEEWDDPVHRETWLGDSSPLSIAHPLRTFLELTGVPETFANGLVADVRKYLHPDKTKLMELGHPYIVDIVSNTLSADLLDYLERDAYFCGIRRAGGDRVLKYLCVLRLRALGDSMFKPVTAADRSGAAEAIGAAPADEDHARGRVVLALYRYQFDHSGVGRGVVTVKKPGLLSEVFELLRSRLALAEKVYFHRTKAAASAMLISAATARHEAKIDLRPLEDHEALAALAGDDQEPNRKPQVEVLTGLRDGEGGKDAVEAARSGGDEIQLTLLTPPNEPLARARRLINSYRARLLYKPIYETKRQAIPGLEYEEEAADVATAVERTRDAAWRGSHEALLERVSGLTPGSVAIYCPDHDMNKKEFRLLVQSLDGGNVQPLDKLVKKEDAVRAEELESIRRGHGRLWRLWVFVDGLEPRNQNDPTVEDFSRACADVIGMPNEIKHLRDRGQSLAQQMSKRVVREIKEEHGVEASFELVNQAIVVATRVSPGEAVDYLSLETKMSSFITQSLKRSRG